MRESHLNALECTWRRNKQGHRSASGDDSPEGKFFRPWKKKWRKRSVSGGWLERRVNTEFLPRRPCKFRKGQLPAGALFEKMQSSRRRFRERKGFTASLPEEGIGVEKLFGAKDMFH